MNTCIFCLIIISNTLLRTIASNKSILFLNLFLIILVSVFFFFLHLIYNGMLSHRERMFIRFMMTMSDRKEISNCVLQVTIYKNLSCVCKRTRPNYSFAAILRHNLISANLLNVGLT